MKKDSKWVIEEAFSEALQREPEPQRQRIILVDGHPDQLKQIKRIMKQYQTEDNHNGFNTCT